MDSPQNARSFELKKKKQIDFVYMFMHLTMVNWLNLLYHRMTTGYIYMGV